MMHLEDPGMWLSPYARDPKSGAFWWYCVYCGWKEERHTLSELECPSAPHRKPSFKTQDEEDFDPGAIGVVSANLRFPIIRKVRR